MSKKNDSFIWPFSFQQIRDDFFNEIESLHNCADQYFSGKFSSLFSKLRKILMDYEISKVFFIGNTYSYFASQIASQMIMVDQNEISFSLYCVELSEFFDYMLPQEPEKALYIFISKSGKSRFLQECVDHLRLSKISPETVWLITNNQNTSLASFISNRFPMFVSSEIVLGTKSFINTLFIVYLITRVLLGKEAVDSHLQRKIHIFLSDLANFRENWEKPTEYIESFLGDFDDLYIISRDPASMAAASLSALHAKSFTRLLTEGTYISHFFHGPFQILEKKIYPREIRILMFVGDRTTNEATIYRLVKLILERAGKVLVLSNNPAVSDTLRKNKRISLVDFTADIQVLSPIFELFILQFVLLKIAEKKGLLQKS
ncbi:MAG: SIS domain-containing protein [Candidatus Lokiarchaeota archaeon]|nr:SIS domain-containing protein [Candidatus Harpocratesius repetitus]